MIIMCVLRLFVIEEDNQRLENLLRLGLLAYFLSGLSYHLICQGWESWVMDMAKG